MNRLPQTKSSVDYPPKLFHPALSHPERERKVSIPVEGGVSLRNLTVTFLRLGATCFGSAMLPMIEEEVVHKKKWLPPQDFVDAVGLAGLVPGPMTLKVAAYVGWLMSGWKGAFITIICFAFPSLTLIILLSLIYFNSSHATAFNQFFFLLTPVVAALLFTSGFRLGRQAWLRLFDGMLLILAFLGTILKLSPFLLLWGLGLTSLAAGLIKRQVACRNFFSS